MEWSEVATQAVFSALPALLVGWEAMRQTERIRISEERIRKEAQQRESETIHRRTTGLLIAVMREIDMVLERVKDLPINADCEQFPNITVVDLIRQQYGDLDVNLSNLIETGYGNYAHYRSRGHRIDVDWKITAGSLSQAFSGVKAELLRRGHSFA